MAELDYGWDRFDFKQDMSAYTRAHASFPNMLFDVEHGDGGTMFIRIRDMNAPPEKNPTPTTFEGVGLDGEEITFTSEDAFTWNAVDAPVDTTVNEATITDTPDDFDDLLYESSSV